jgi:hypothetical protein
MEINRKELYDILDEVLTVTDEWGGCKLASWQWGSNVVVDGIDDAIDEILNYLGVNKSHLGVSEPEERPSIDEKRETISIDSMPKEFFETPPMPQHVLDDFSDSKNRIENIGRKCNCDLFGKNMLALHESCEMAALNGVGIKLEPMKYCPWCGGTVTQFETAMQSEKDNYSIRLQESLDSDEEEMKALNKKYFGGKEYLIDDRVSFDLSVIPIAEEREDDEAGTA